MQDVVIVAATRTPIGSFHGALAPLSAVELGSVVIRSLLEKTAVAPEQIDEVIFGQVLTAGCGQNPARQTALRAGLLVTTPALTLNLVCGSGMKAVVLARKSRQSASHRAKNRRVSWIMTNSLVRIRRLKSWRSSNQRFAQVTAR